MRLAQSIPFETELAAGAWAQRISVARRARRWTIRDLASKAGVGASTMVQIEKGKPSVQLSKWLRVLWALDLVESLREAAKPEGDSLEVELMTRELPKRVRR